MTRDDLVAYTKHLIFENAATTAIGSDADLESTVDNANKKVWRYCVKQAPSLFETRSPDTAIAADGSVDLATLGAVGVYLLSRVFVKATQYLSGSDPYLPLEPLDGDERYVFGRNIVNAPAFAPEGYYLEGERLYVAPASGAQTLQIVYVPNLATMAADDPALGGRLTPFHELVALEAAIVLAVKDEANVSGLVLLRNESKKDLLLHLTKRQRQRPKVIREVPFA